MRTWLHAAPDCASPLQRGWNLPPTLVFGAGATQPVDDTCRLVSIAGAVTHIVQLSDLHLLGSTAEQSAILEALVGALERDRHWRGSEPHLLVITGDVFDTATVDTNAAVRAFRILHEAVKTALGGTLPTVVVPGNHDRRRLGLFGPQRDELFVALARAMGNDVWVHGRRTPFLAEVLPHELHGRPLWVVAYDSTYLPRGMLSAGGVLRQEDLLQAASTIGDQHLDWPVLFLLHHHLVSTPLTDLGTIEADQAHPLVRWAIRQLLPRVVAHADREELTMTALGAGTALSTLHSLGRAVIVLHGHKHYATARLMSGLRAGQGDLLLVSAGSAGTAQSWTHDAGRGTARLWPSFNVIELERDAVAVDTVSFGYKGRSTANPVRRPLVRVRRRGWRWEPLPVTEEFEEERRRRLATNHSTCRLSVSRLFAGERWDFACERFVTPGPGVTLSRYVETVEGLEGSRLTVTTGDGRVRVEPLPAQLTLTRGAIDRYRLEGGVCRTFEEAQRLFGVRSSPFAAVSLMNRYSSESARLVVHGLGEAARDAFASATDLGTGMERPMHLTRNADGVVVDHPSCPPRTLLRIYWRLQRA